MVEQLDAVFGGAVVGVERYDDAACGLRMIGLQLAQSLGVIGAYPTDRLGFDAQYRDVMPVAGEMEPGDAGFHNGLLAHGAGPNMTPNWRRAMTAGYMPDGSTFNGKQNVLSDEQVAALQVGDLLNDEAQNPLLWPPPA